jgi:hypothetical protein
VIIELLWRQGDLGDLSPYWDSAMNVAAASYYGVDKIIAGED